MQWQYSFDHFEKQCRPGPTNLEEDNLGENRIEPQFVQSQSGVALLPQLVIHFKLHGCAQAQLSKRFHFHKQLLRRAVHDEAAAFEYEQALGEQSFFGKLRDKENRRRCGMRPRAQLCDDLK